jgi:uncharacterized ferredoxin-like protein
MRVKSQEMEERGALQAAELMCLAARTAPKGRGVDNLSTLVVTGRDKDILSAEMRKIAKESGSQFFERDANCVDKALAVVLLGQKINVMGVVPCGYCGYADCAENVKHKGMCAVSIGDLGIALGSAVSVAAQHRVDNRVMFSIGRAALNLEYFEETVTIAYGIPLSVSGKSPFFDRG